MGRPARRPPTERRRRVKVSKWPGRRAKPFYVKYRDADGGQKYPAFATHAEATRWIEQNGRRVRIARGLEAIVDPASTVAVYGKHWLAALTGSVKARSHEHYAAHFARYLKPRLGGRPVAELNRPELRAFLVACRQCGTAGKPLATGSIYAVYATLRAMLNAAIEDGIRA